MFEKKFKEHLENLKFQQMLKALKMPVLGLKSKGLIKLKARIIRMEMLLSLKKINSLIMGIFKYIMMVNGFQILNKKLQILGIIVKSKECIDFKIRRIEIFLMNKLITIVKF